MGSPNRTKIFGIPKDIHANSTQCLADNIRLPRQQSSIYHLQERTLQYIFIEKDDHITIYYTMFKVLGRGSYGVVYAARENLNNSPWAIKILTKKDGRISKPFEREIEILKFVNHPNIIRLHCIVESPLSVYLIIDLCDGVLSELFKAKKRLNECEARRIMKELGDAVSYLHYNGIVHRDIKMENILLLKDDSDISECKFTTKLTDFGLSTVRTGSSFKDMIHDRCGTLAYMAPEIIIKRSYSQQCDIWAIGVLLFAIISGEFPFARATDTDIKFAITSEDPNLDAIRVKSATKDSLVHLIQRLLHKDPAHRSTASEITDHPWILQQPLQSLKSCNVLDMMAQWRDDLSGNGRGKNDLQVLPVKEVDAHAQKPRRIPSRNYGVTVSMQKSKCVSNPKRNSKDLKLSKLLEMSAGKGGARQSVLRPRTDNLGVIKREEIKSKDSANKEDLIDKDNTRLNKKLWR